MEKTLKILIVEDDPTDCRELVEEFGKNEDAFYLSGVTNNSTQALRLVTDTAPDVVILDLELHRGGGDGLDFLKKLKSAALPLFPYILITTNNISSVTHKAARVLGADFIMTKNQEGYSARSVVDFLRTTKTFILERSPQDDVPYMPELNNRDNKQTLRLINSELLGVGINPKAVGYKYLTDAIMITIREPVPHICNVIGKKYGKSENSVERAMQNAVNRAWNTSDINDLLSRYTAKISSDKGVPTITEFIFYYARKVNNSL